MSQVLLKFISIVTELFQGIVSNWMYDLLNKRGAFPHKPRLKHMIVVILVFLPVLLVKALPELRSLIGTRHEPIDDATFSNEMRDVFPVYIGSTWVYHTGKVTESHDGQGSNIESVIGNYTETVVALDSGPSDRFWIVGTKVSGENYLNKCAGNDLSSGDLDVWYVLNEEHLYQVCSRSEAYEIALEMRSEDLATIHYLPTYVAPFEVGKLWPAFPDLPPREDTAYQWFVEAKVDVTVPAGEFKNCYRLLLYTLPDTTIRWVCPGFGMVASTYHHRGSVVDYRAELKSFEVGQ